MSDRRALDIGPPGVERRKPGRPRIGRAVVVVIPDGLYADLCAEARNDAFNGEADNVSAVIRRRCSSRLFRISETKTAIRSGYPSN
jgi:hypothetical protein